MEKYQKFEQCYPDCLRLGICADIGALPFLFKEELDIDKATEDEHAFNEEPWYGSNSSSFPLPPCIYLHVCVRLA